MPFQGDMWVPWRVVTTVPSTGEFTGFQPTINRIAGFLAFDGTPVLPPKPSSWPPFHQWTRVPRKSSQKLEGISDLKKAWLCFNCWNFYQQGVIYLRQKYTRTNFQPENYHFETEHVIQEPDFQFHIFLQGGVPKHTTERWNNYL